MVNKYGDKIPFEKTFNKIIKKLNIVQMSETGKHC